MDYSLINTALIILLLPLAAFVIQIFFGKRLPRGGDYVSVLAILASWLLSIKTFIDILFKYDPSFKVTQKWMWFDFSHLSQELFLNLNLSPIKFEVGLLLDNVSVLMLMVVTTISTLVHVYSIGYMHGDSRYARFFAYLSLFSFSMLGLVLTDNLFVLYIFWELVGVSSYLLIGFWFEKPSAADACKKAFLTNRVGDMGMFIGIMMVVLTLGHTSYEAFFNGVTQNAFSHGFLTVIGLCLFLGAMGKSAQFPLHIWLPDAMEGPTPVSALIHAATMVAAGVYMVTRLFVVFTPEALLIIAYVGGFTALFAATIALTHRDIKKVLAYSTVSQLGLMMLALGVGAYTAGFFHLVTHASFKACLFLVAGSVIHALHGEQDLFKMGGLRKKLPFTFATGLIATLAISGVPLFSGFVSKDQILAGILSFAFANPQHSLLVLFGFGASALTAFYMFRLLFLAFFGEARETSIYNKAHESPLVMTLPLIILATLSLGILYNGSFLGFGEVKVFGDKSNWFNFLLTTPSSEIHAHAAHSAHEIAMYASIILVSISVFLSWLFYMKIKTLPQKLSQKCALIYKTLVNLYWIDEIYEAVFINPLIRLNNFLYGEVDNKWIDKKMVDGVGVLTARAAHNQGHFDNVVIDRTVDGSGELIFSGGLKLVRLQSGKLQQYLMIGLGFVLVIIFGIIIL